jgi:hypothetical protein
MSDNTEEVVTELIDAWNVGLRCGSFVGFATDPKRVRQIMSELGINVRMVYKWSSIKRETSYTMIKSSETDTIKNPFDEVQLFKPCHG